MRRGLQSLITETMDTVTKLAREAFEPKLGRPMADDEAAEYAMHLRRLAAFLLDCAQDPELLERLGVRREGEGRAAPRAIDSTTPNDGNPLPARLPTRTAAPTGAPLRDSTHRESSAFPAVSAAAVPADPVQATPPARSS